MVSKSVHIRFNLRSESVGIASPVFDDSAAVLSTYVDFSSAIVPFAELLIAALIIVEAGAPAFAETLKGGDAERSFTAETNSCRGA